MSSRKDTSQSIARDDNEPEIVRDLRPVRVLERSTGRKGARIGKSHIEQISPWPESMVSTFSDEETGS